LWEDKWENDCVKGNGRMTVEGKWENDCVKGNGRMTVVWEGGRGE
jgi:hypothetical protein